MKKIIIIMVGVLIAFVGAALVTPMLIDQQKMKDIALSQIKSSTGYEIAVDGGFSLRLFPVAGFHAEKVTVAKSGSAAFAKVESIDVGVKIIPLIKGKVEVTRLHLDKPVLNLVQQAGGNNWQPKPQKIVAREENNYGSPRTLTNAPPIILSDARISGGSLHYHDARTGKKMALDALNVKVNDRAANVAATWDGKPLKLSLSADSLLALSAGKKVKLNSEFVWDSLSLAVKGALQCVQQQCSIDDGAFNVNGQSLTGTVKAAFGGAKPVIEADLSGGVLDLSAFMTKKQASLSLITPAYAADARWSAAPIDFSFANAIQGTVKLAVDKLTANAFSAEKLALLARFTGQSLVIDAQSGGLYQGQGTLKATIGASGAIDSNATLQAVQLEPLLTALSGSSDLAGKLNGKLNVRTSGKNEQQLVGNLSGSGDVRVADGKIKGVDLAGMVRNIQSAYKDVDKSARSTDFTEAGGSFTIAQGIVTNNDFAMKAPLFRVTGKGTVDLPRWQLDYLLSPQVVETITGQGGKEKSGIGVPVRITGPLDNPSYAPDLSGALEEVIKNPEAIGKTIKENIGGVKDLLKDGKSLLKGF